MKKILLFVLLLSSGCEPGNYQFGDCTLKLGKTVSPTVIYLPEYDTPIVASEGLIVVFDVDCSKRKVSRAKKIFRD